MIEKLPPGMPRAVFLSKKFTIVFPVPSGVPSIAPNLMPVMSQCYSVIIDRGISAHGNGKEVVYGLNAVDKCYIYQLISNVQLTRSNRFDPQMQIHTGN